MQKHQDKKKSFFISKGSCTLIGSGIGAEGGKGGGDLTNYSFRLCTKYGRPLCGILRPLEE